jgi:hypothetical protein
MPDSHTIVNSQDIQRLDQVRLRRKNLRGLDRELKRMQPLTHQNIESGRRKH